MLMKTAWLATFVDYNRKGDTFGDEKPGHKVWCSPRDTRYPIAHDAIEALSIIISVYIILVSHVTVAD